jgi:hypothetical protein
MVRLTMKATVLLLDRRTRLPAAAADRKLRSCSERARCRNRRVWNTTTGSRYLPITAAALAPGEVRVLDAAALADMNDFAFLRFELSQAGEAGAIA